MSTLYYYIDCTDGDIQLVPYSSYSDLVGRVEICSNGKWGAICNDFFDDIDASVVCKQLGHNPIGIKFTI